MSTIIPFTKAQATGNDFIIFLKKECPKIISSPNFINKICKRRTGIGADGVLIISNHNTVDYKIDYYNSDGSWETFCANGARCVGKLLKEKGIIKQKAIFESGDGIHKIKFDNSNIAWIKMRIPVYKTDYIKLFGFSGRFIDSGAKHFACKSKTISKEIAQKFGPLIRYSKEFAPDGINVNFFKQHSKNKISVISYEKGIEKVMLSCGSGSLAATFHANNIDKMISPVNINVPGGNLKLNFDKSWKNVWLGGPAVILFQSEININKILPTIS